MPKFAPQTKTFLIITALVCTVAITGFAFVVRTALSSRDAYRKELAAYEGLSVRASANESERDILRSATDDLHKIDAGFAHAKAIVDVIQEFEELGDRAGVTANIASVQTGEQSDGLGALELELVVDGSWQRIMQTVRLVEEGTFFTTIERVGIGQGGGGNARWRAVLLLSIPLVP